MFGKLACRFGKHQRSRTRAKLVGQYYVSNCVRCDVAMRQTGHDGWEIDRGQPFIRNSGRFLDLD